MEQMRAIVLKTLLVKDSDLLILALTESLGKIQLLARGAKRSRKRFLGGLDIFDTGTIELATRREKDLSYTVEHFIPGVRWKTLTSSLDALTAAALCVELSDVFCATDDISCGVLFRPLFTSIRAIDAHQEVTTQLTYASYYSLLVLQHAGVDPLEAGIIVQGGWLAAMQQSQAPIVPNTPSVFAELLSLLDYIEEEGSQRLNCKGQVVHLVKNLSRDRRNRPTISQDSSD